jgi:hypothetical protein
MYSSIKGIAGNAVPAVRQLELPAAIEEDEVEAAELEADQET